MVISKKPLHFIATLLIAFMPLLTSANSSVDTTKVEAHSVATDKVSHEEKHEKALTQKEKIKEFINHHLLDSHSFNFNANEETGEHYGFSLPIILWDNGFQVFSSSKFHNGEEVAEHNGNYYVLKHEKIYKVEDASGKLKI
jgi:F-type H+-transporting ATPase subunit a